MTEQQLNWKDEEQKLGTGGVSFNKTLKVDTPYSVTFLDEGTQYEDEYQGQKRQKLAMKVRVTGGGIVGDDMSWYITKSKRRDSLYGMLVTLFNRAGQAKGVTLDVVATGSNKDRRYGIRQYTELVFQKK